MSTDERAIRWLAERLEGVDAGYRRDVTTTACEIVQDASRPRRWLELLSLAALALRLRSPLRRGSRPEAIWGDGLRLGALLSLTALACDAAAHGTAPSDLAVAAGLVAAVAAELSGRRLVAVALVLATATFELESAGVNAHSEALAAICLVAVGGLAAGPAKPVRHRWGWTLAVAAISLAALLAAIVVGANAPATASRVTFAWVCPCALVVLGSLDPRLAAAATTVVFARLAASGFGELGHALAVLHEGQRDLLARWLLMGTGVVAAWVVTHRVIGRQSRL